MWLLDKLWRAIPPKYLVNAPIQYPNAGCYCIAGLTNLNVYDINKRAALAIPRYFPPNKAKRRD